MKGHLTQIYARLKNFTILSKPIELRLGGTLEESGTPTLYAHTTLTLTSRSAFFARIVWIGVCVVTSPLGVANVLSGTVALDSPVPGAKLIQFSSSLMPGN